MCACRAMRRSLPPPLLWERGRGDEVEFSLRSDMMARALQTFDAAEQADAGVE